MSIQTQLVIFYRKDSHGNLAFSPGLYFEFWFAGLVKHISNNYEHLLVLVKYISNYVRKFASLVKYISQVRPGHCLRTFHALLQSAKLQVGGLPLLSPTVHIVVSLSLFIDTCSLCHCLCYCHSVIVIVILFLLLALCWHLATRILFSHIVPSRHLS